MRMRKKQNLGPRMEHCGQLLVTEPEALRGHWREKLTPDCALRLELGCGKGRFTCETAAREPDVLFVAIERVPDAMVIAMERAEAAGLKNVLFIDGFVENMSGYFARGEVERIYINFCDPWPSKRHTKRRLTCARLLMFYSAILSEGGTIEFKTDNADLFEWSLTQFPEAGYELSNVTRDLHETGICGIMTDYEEKFHNLGTHINRCVATRKSSGG